jgi:predicted transcriptional regulator
MKIRTLHELRDEMRAVARKEQTAPADAAEPTYENEAAVRKSAENFLRLLTPDNRSLLQMIDTEHPESIDALALKLGREPSNVSRTLAKLVNLGLVRLVTGPGRVKTPQLVARHVTISLDVCHPIDQIVVQ